MAALLPNRNVLFFLLCCGLLCRGLLCSAARTLCLAGHTHPPFQGNIYSTYHMNRPLSIKDLLKGFTEHVARRYNYLQTNHP